MFVVSDVRLGVREVGVETKRGSFMSVIVYSVHNNILPAIATQCCLFECDSQPWLTLAFQALLSCTSRAPGNMHVPLLLVPLVMGTATSLCLRYLRIRKEIEHDAAFDKVRSVQCLG